MADLAQCLALLKATTDEHRFVGLLLVTKLMHTPEDLQRVFEDGMPFVRRLLLTTADAGGGGVEVPSGTTYRGLALSVLASFCSDATLAARPELGACATAAAAPLFDGTTATSELLDSVAVLDAVLRQPECLTGPMHGRLLSTVVATAAALPAPAKASRDGTPSAPSPPSLACELLERISSHYVAASGADEGSLARGAELLDAARLLAPAAGSRRDVLAFARLAALRALVEAADRQLELARGAAAVSAGASVPTGAAEAEEDASRAITAAGIELRAALVGPLASKLPPAARSDALCAS